MTKLFVRFLPFLALSLPALASVIVGHPVPLQAAGGAGLTVTSVSLDVTDQIVTFCDQSTLTIEIDDVLEAGDPILLPEGTICEVRLLLASEAEFAGTGNGGQFTLSLAVQEIVIPVNPSLVVTGTTSDADRVRLAAPGWITATSLGLSNGVTVQVASGHALHDGLAQAVAVDSRIER